MAKKLTPITIASLRPKGELADETSDGGNSNRPLR